MLGTNEDYGYGVMYRYEYHHIGRNLCLYLQKYAIVKQTPKGVWIQILGDVNRFVLTDGKKKFAYHTKKEALTNLILRTTRYASILESRLRVAKDVLWEADKLKTTEL
jgi:hypothetical protein